jgi:hypothetical protein
LQIPYLYVFSQKQVASSEQPAASSQQPETNDPD